MVPRPQKMPTAVNSANQAALERLIEKKNTLGPNDRYAFTLKKAIESLQNCTTTIASHADACKLKFVGTHCATLICPPDKERLQQREKRRTKVAAAAAVLATQAAQAADASSVGSTSSLACSVTSKQSRQRQRQRQQNMTSQQLQKIAELPSTKETNYQKAVANAIQWKAMGPLTWRVILIIDARERHSEHVQAKCQMSGIPCEERHLPIGDMAWIAQGFTPSRSNNNNKVVAELMLGTIIERKTTEDLKASLFGTRYLEQRKRLQNCGLPQLIFLIEGDLTKDMFNCSADTLHTAAWETRLHLGFAIVLTAHLQDTVMQLKRMHRRILQRTFPRAFTNRNDALPTFEEAHRSQPQPPPPQQQHSQTRHDNSDAYRRRKRRLQSLNEMTFDIDPKPCLGMDRFITYAELKAKIELDRERGTRTVGNIHLAMLKQVTGFSNKKCLAVARLYPTFSFLMEAYESRAGDDGGTDANHAAKQNLVTEVSTQEEGQEMSARSLKVGPRGSRELYVAYQTDDPEASQSNNNSNNNAIPRSISRDASSPSSTGPLPAASATKPAARNLWKPDERMRAVPECIDLLSPVPPTRHSKLENNDFSSPDDDGSFAAAAAAAASSPVDGYQDPSELNSPRQRSSGHKKRKKSINTSFGSLLNDSSSSDDEVAPVAKRSLLTVNNLKATNEVIEID